MKLHAAFRVAVATAGAAAGVLAVAAASPASGQSACTATSGVTVVVDFSAFGRGIVRGCAPGRPASGYDALVTAGFAPAGTTRFGNAFVCRIDALPSPSDQGCVDTPPSTAYWAYYHAAQGDATWRYSTLGAAAFHPEPGSVEGWAFGAGAKPGVSPAQLLPPPPPPPTTARPAPAPTATLPPPPSAGAAPGPAPRVAAAPGPAGAPLAGAAATTTAGPLASASPLPNGSPAPTTSVSSTSTSAAPTSTAPPTTSATTITSTTPDPGGEAAAPVAVRDAGTGSADGGGGGGSPVGVVIAAVVIGVLAAVVAVFVRGRRLRT
jgi:hypothetical protein